MDAAGKLNKNVKVSNILSSDVFIHRFSSDNDAWKKMGVMAVEI